VDDVSLHIEAYMSTANILERLSGSVGHGTRWLFLCQIMQFLLHSSEGIPVPSLTTSLIDYRSVFKVTASVLRNLSWRADSSSKEAHQQANVVRALITVSMETHLESTL
jgi:hypothetical protein